MSSAPGGGRALRRGVAAGAATGAALLSVRALLRRQEGRSAGLIDWREARTIARRRCGSPEGLPSEVRDRLGARYDELAAELAPHMAEVCQEVPSAYPAFTVVDRHGFIDTNLVLARRLLEPVERLQDRLPRSGATALGRIVLTRYVGELFGMVSRRVLGQYDPVLMMGPVAMGAQPEPALFLVEPNVAAFEASQHVSGLSLRRWLILHELTHAWQFGSHPWLRRHLLDLMEAVIGSALAAAERPPSPLNLVRQLPNAVRGQLAFVGRIQAVMSVLEGYGNFVMHEVGHRHIENAVRLEEAFHRRSRERTALERLVSTLVGMNLKLRQYELGERFAREVSARGGLTLLNRVWESPQMLPSMTELRRPELWVERAG